jgi:hypothetical protein
LPEGVGSPLGNDGNHEFLFAIAARVIVAGDHEYQNKSDD